MSEELALDNAFRDSSRVHGDHRFIRPLTRAVDRFCDDFFARPAFAGDKNRQVGGSDLLQDVDDLGDLHRLADDTMFLLELVPVHQYFSTTIESILYFFLISSPNVFASSAVVKLPAQTR